jgi:hypothetical protein
LHNDDDDGEQPEHHQQHELAAADISEQLQHLAPAQAAAAAAAASAKRLVKQQADPDGDGAYVVGMVQLTVLCLICCGARFVTMLLLWRGRTATPTYPVWP